MEGIYEKAISYYSQQMEVDIENDHVRKHASELVFCYKNGKGLLDFDFWTQYEELLGEQMSFPEYLALDRTFDGDPHDITPSDKETIGMLKQNLEELRQKQSPRILVDSYTKGEKYLFGSTPSQREENAAFNRRISAVNRMYGWLYDQGILGKVSFEFKDYSSDTEFALDVRDLIPYRQAMENSGIEDAETAVYYIFDADCTPCHYSGAIELGWTMSTYRNVDGCVGRSWECGLIRGLNTDGIYEVSRVREEKGTKEAVKALFAQYTWGPSDLCREGEKKQLQDQIQTAEKRADSAPAFSHETEKTHDPER